METMKGIGLAGLVWVVIACSGVAFAQPNIQLGSATGAPGDTVTIPVTFANNNGSVVGLQFDVQFDSTKVIVGSPTGGAVLPPHLLHTSTPSAGTLRVLVRPEVSASLPNINNGVIVSIPFTIDLGGTPGGYSLTLPGEAAVFSDKSANKVLAGTLTNGQITVGTPDISVSLMALNFGGVKVGSPLTNPITVSNASEAAASLAVDPTGLNASEFQVESDSCSEGPIPPGGHCTVEVSLHPTSTGLKGAKLSIVSNAAVSPMELPVALCHDRARPQ